MTLALAATVSDQACAFNCRVLAIACTMFSITDYMLVAGMSVLVDEPYTDACASDGAVPYSAPVCTISTRNLGNVSASSLIRLNK